jgi:hypothetical protein
MTYPLTFLIAALRSELTDLERDMKAGPLSTVRKMYLDARVRKAQALLDEMQKHAQVEVEEVKG